MSVMRPGGSSCASDGILSPSFSSSRINFSDKLYRRSFFQQLGSTVGLAVLGGVFAASLGAAGEAAVPGSAAFREASANAISAVFRVSVFIAVLGALVTAFLPEHPLRANRTLEDDR